MTAGASHKTVSLRFKWLSTFVHNICVFLRRESFYTLIAAPKAVCFAQRRTTDVGVIFSSAQEKSVGGCGEIPHSVCAHLLPKCLSPAGKRGVDKRAGHINNGQIYGLRSFGSARKGKGKLNPLSSWFTASLSNKEPKSVWIMDSVSPLFSLLLSLAAHCREMMCNLGCAARGMERAINK